jgi:hydrogenase nickel incorporation protein HypB
VNPTIEVIRVSARTGEGMQDWLAWLRTNLAAKSNAEAAE